MYASYMSISLDSDDESSGSSISYIILSDTETEDTASPTIVPNYAPPSNHETKPFEAPPSPDYTPALDTETKPLEAPALPDYTSGLNIEFEPSEYDLKESEEDPSKDDSSEEDPMKDDESLPARTAPILPTITVRVPYGLPPEIKVAIAEEIAAPHRKRGRSPPPSLSSAAPSSHHHHHQLCYYLARAPIVPVTGEPDQHTIPLLVARLVHHKDRIHDIHDHLEEIPLERFESMEHELEILREQEVDTLQVTLGVTLERIIDLEIRMEDTET
ncbi:hypothetical protein Tco_0349066 [Tanacetum coccineum]